MTPDASDLLLLLVIGVTGFVIAWQVRHIRRAEDAQRRMVAAATAHAERLDAILNTTVDGMVMIDGRGTIEAFNRGASQLFGYPESEVLGRNVSMLMPSPHHEEHDGYLARYLATGEARIIGKGREVMARRRDGSLFPVHLSVSEMKIGSERKFSGLLHDLTKRKQLGEQLEASEARWQAIVDSALDGIVVIDIYGRIESFNRGAEQMFGYAATEVAGRNVDMLMPSPYKEEHDGYMARYIATGRAKIIGIGREVQGLRKDGTTFPLHLSVGEITLDGQRKFTGIMHDLTNRVALEGQLREQASLARLGEMAAVIAHEVKNPLAGIRGAIQVVGSRMPADNPSGPILKEIVARIDALDHMMKDLLLFARPPKPKRQPTEVTLLVESTAALLRQDPALKDLDIQIETDAPVVVAADPEMLKIVLQNLFINSAHAMENKGTIHVRVSVDAAMCDLVVADAGPGIPADVRQKVFTPFFTTKARGSGLGLPTAKRLIEVQQGQITIDCPPAGGTSVHIRLPLDTTD